MAVWYRYRTAEKDALRYLVAALTFYVKANPDEDDAMDALKTVKAELSKGDD